MSGKFGMSEKLCKCGKLKAPQTFRIKTRLDKIKFKYEKIKT